jgi:hypothetical protein
MRVSGRRLSRLELGFIAAALLLPVPLVALNGYAAALPAAVERGLGSLVTLEAVAGNDRSGLEASGQASEDGSNAQRSADGSLRITRAGATSSTDGKTKPSASSESEAAPGSSDDSHSATPNDEPSDEAGDTGGSGPSGESGGASGDGEGGSSATSGGTPGVSLTIGGGGTGTGVSAGSSGVSVELGADSEGAGGAVAPTAAVEVTDQEGSSSGVGISVPGSGSAIP